MPLKKIFTSKGLWEKGSIVLRVLAGLIIFKYGLEIFAADKMKGYTDWLRNLGFPAPEWMAYAGKVSELVGGLLLALGLFTRVAAVSLIITMAVIAFVMGEPQWLAADGPFLLLLIYFHFLLTGPGKWSLDHLLFNPSRNAGI